MNTAADVRHWLFEEFSARLATVFETMAGERPPIDIEPSPGMPADTSLRWNQPFSSIPGAAWVTASDAGWNIAGGHVLRAAGIEESDPASLKSTYLETISQALSGVASAMGARLGREVSCTGGEESTAATGVDAGWCALHIRLGLETASIAIGFDAALVSSLVASSDKDAGSPSRIEEAGAAVAATASFTGPINSKTFELLLDVELPVSVSFGRARVALKDVLKLTTGSIVELNRSILEPVEVIVNNCVIARGEVVVVEGNFGVRIHQVISRQERLRTLN
jgi:flagellar motor switch protein FliN/FliY